ELAQEIGVERRIAERQYRSMILRRGAEHGRATHVDLFDRFVDGDAFLRNRRLEWIEIDDDEIDRRDAEAVDVGAMGIVRAVEEDRDRKSTRLNSSHLVRSYAV